METTINKNENTQCKSSLFIEDLKDLYLIANEFDKHVTTFNHFILDLTETNSITNASLLADNVKLVHRPRFQCSYTNKGATNVRWFNSLEQSFDSIVAGEKAIGILVMDSTTTSDQFNMVYDYLEYLHPPVLVLGSSQFDDALAESYTGSYTIDSHVSGKQIGKVYYYVGQR